MVVILISPTEQPGLAAKRYESSAKIVQLICDDNGFLPSEGPHMLMGETPFDLC